MEPIKCPVCKTGKLKINTTKINIPHYGLAYLLTLICDKCGFKTTDVILDKVKPPARYTAEVKSETDQRIKVVKSSTAFIKVPELGLKMEPGPSSQGFITNIEGILLKMKELTEMVKQWSEEEEKKNRCSEVLRKIDEVLNCKRKITMELEDPFGNSLMYGEEGQKIKKEALSDDEIKKLKLNISV